MASPKTYSGSDGRFRAVGVAPDLTIPVPTLSGSTAAVVGIQKWTTTFHSSNGEPLVQFEGTTTTGGLIWEEQIQGGSIGYEVDIEGYTDLTASTGTFNLLYDGLFVYADFILSRGAPFGFAGAGGRLQGLTFGAEVKGGPQTFKCKLLGHKAWPALSAVS